MTEYRRSVTLFAKSAPSIKCIRSHFFPESNGVCALMGTKNHEELFVLANRVGETIKVSKVSLQVIANILDIEDLDQWYEHLREQRRIHKERVAEDLRLREEQRKASAKTVLLRKKRPNSPLVS